MAVLVLLISVVLLISASHARLVADTAEYSIWQVPDDVPEDAVGIQTLAGAALIGGGDNCEPAFRYMIHNANGGDFLVVRASSDDSYNDYVYELSGSMNETLNSVTTVKFKSRSASFAPEVLKYFQQAELVFFAGGDQSLYLDLWRDTPVQQVVQEKIDAQVTIGGTSAGLAILGTYIYSASNDTVFSDEAMENPYNMYMTMAPPLLRIPSFTNVVTDTHFVKRNRMGRLLSFLARAELDLLIPEYRVLGVDEQSALLLDVSTGIATTVGKGVGAFVCFSSRSPQRCVSGQPLQFDDITCHRTSSQMNDWFDFSRNAGSGVTYSVGVTSGAIVGQPYGP